jgi:hypothetical protein
MGGNGSTGGNRSKYHNKNSNSGNAGGHNRKNSTGGGGRGGPSSQTNNPTGSDGQSNAPWPTYSHPWQGHMLCTPAPCPLDNSVHRPLWPHRASTSLVPPCRAAAAVAAIVPASHRRPRMELLAQCGLGPEVAGQLFQLHGAPPASYLDPGLGGGLQRDAPHHSISW